MKQVSSVDEIDVGRNLPVEPPFPISLNRLTERSRLALQNTPFAPATLRVSTNLRPQKPLPWNESGAGVGFGDERYPLLVRIAGMEIHRVQPR